MKVFELLPRPLGKVFRKLTHLTCNSPLWSLPIFTLCPTHAQCNRQNSTPEAIKQRPANTTPGFAIFQPLPLKTKRGLPTSSSCTTQVALNKRKEKATA